MAEDTLDHDWLERLRLFNALDLETHLIEAGRLAPPIVCGSWAWFDADGIEGTLAERHGAINRARSLLDSDAVIVGANVAFDFGCLANADESLLPLIFRAYAERRVFDVQVAQALDAIAYGRLYIDPETMGPMRGRYSLETCVKQVLGRADAKSNDYWRKRYALLEHVNIADWPDEAKLYPVDDAVNTLEVARSQVAGQGAGATPGPHRNLGDLADQVETAFDLHLGAIWGLRTDRARVERLRARTEKTHAEFVKRFAAVGFFKKDEKTGEIKVDRRAVKRAIITAYSGGLAVAGCPSGCAGGKVLSEKSGKPVNCKTCDGTGLDVSGAPRTPSGGVSGDRDTLVESGDHDLTAFGENEAEKIRDTYLPFLESGVDRPISLRPNVLVASGRVSYDGIIQLLPREGGVRECIMARFGRVFCDVDFAAIELCTLAQVCLWVLGRSHIADTINATGDPGMLHTALAASMRGVSTEQMQAWLTGSDKVLKLEAKKYRQAAKALNFGLPGGMGAAKLVLSKRKKSEGSTTAPDGTVYPGVRFCVLLGGQEHCGVEKLREWNGREIPPVCKACVELVHTSLRPAWFRQWPEIKPYFDWVTSRVGEFGQGELPCFGTKRMRGGLDFTNGANNGFQALAADGAKNALRKLTRECYGVGPQGKDSVLYGDRPIFFVHDSIMAELREGTAHLAGPRMAEIMVAAMREYVPDVTVRAEPALMRHWIKVAEPHYIEDQAVPGGRKLVPWDDHNTYEF